MKNMKSYRAWVSLWFEHGIFIKDNVKNELKVEFGDQVGFELNRPSFRSRTTIEKVREFKEIDPDKEARMLLSVFDHIANQHYYFLTEFGFTEKVGWKPHQYDYILKIPAFDKLRENSKEYKVFKKVYSLVEEKFIDFTMYLRTEKNIEPTTILAMTDPKMKSAKEELMKIVDGATSEVKDLIKHALKEADVVVGVGSFFSSIDFPIEESFLISGIDVGSFAYHPNPLRALTANPFMAFWVISSIFKLSNKELKPSLLPITMVPLRADNDWVKKAKKVKLKVYNPSKIVSQLIQGGEEGTINWVRRKVYETLEYKSIYLYGDVLLPFTSPAKVKEFEVYDEMVKPFVEPTPYGQVISYEVFPEIDLSTEVEIELFTNPLFDRKKPIVMDTNIITTLTYPYNPRGSFFKTFMSGREIIIPTPVIYELKRKFSIKKEMNNIIRSLTRLYEISGAGYIRLKVLEEPTSKSVSQAAVIAQALRGASEIAKMASGDLVDTAVLLEALRRNAVLFTNDKELRTYALLLGIPSISYNSLLDDVETTIRERKRIRERELIEEVKKLGKEVRDEEYREEDIKGVIEYLVQVRKVRKTRNGERIIEWIS
ncbi:MAG: hypothetical protein J7J20_02950 [Desulfurococcales archaeon]|nr:hypothetical protein [Desulfurococcales archaeon]